MKPSVVYWDACTFLGYLKNEPDKIDACKEVLVAAESGHVKIVTSSLTLVEVLHIKGMDKMDKSKEEVIHETFKQGFVVVSELDRKTAELARQLVWAYNVEPKDAVHLATALERRVGALHTTDKGLTRLEVLDVQGYENLPIRWPGWDERPLPFPPVPD